MGMTSNRRTNDEGSQEVARSTAGASGGRDLELVETKDVALYRCICEERPGKVWTIHARDQRKSVLVMGCEIHTERLAQEMRLAGFAEVRLRLIGELPEWE